MRRKCEETQKTVFAMIHCMPKIDICITICKNLLSPRALQLYCRNYRDSFQSLVRNNPFHFIRSLGKTLLFRFKHRSKNYQYIAWAHSGFFANLRAIVYEIITAEENGKTPVVVSSRYALEKYNYTLSAQRNLYWAKAGYQGRHNTWEYYFEPLSGISVDFDFIAIRDVKKTYEKPRFFPKEDFTANFSQYGYVNKKWAQSNGLSDYPTPAFQFKMAEVLKRYVKIKPVIMEQVEVFYRENMAGHAVIGIHIRRTDLENRESIGITNELYVELLGHYPEYQKIFLATDCERTLCYMQTVFRDQLLHTVACRGKDHRGIHNQWEPELSKPRLGEEVLLDALLLARCDFFIHGNSSMNFAVLNWHPPLPHINVFEYVQQRSVARLEDLTHEDSRFSNTSMGDHSN